MCKRFECVFFEIAFFKTILYTLSKVRLFMGFVSSKFEAAGFSDIGNVRKQNEDVFALLPDLGLFLLADGMGGHAGGEVAAKLAVDTFADFIKKNIAGLESVEALSDLIGEAYRVTNETVFNQARTSSEYRDMGTTLCALLLREKRAIISHIGDSRIYLFHQEKLSKLTEDHTVANEPHRQLSESQAERSKHILSRAIGPFAVVTPSIEVCPYSEGDLFLVCSDGLTGSLSDQEIEKILVDGGSRCEAGKQLISLSLQKWGKDNITLILVKMGDE